MLSKSLEENRTQDLGTGGDDFEKKQVPGECLKVLYNVA